MADEVLAESVAGELIDTEIEIRSGRGETFAEAIELQSERRARLFARGREAADRARDHRHPPVGELPRPADHRHRALQPPARGAALGRPAQQHMEPARARRRPRRRPRDRRLRPPAGPAAAAARALGELAVPRRPGHRPALGAHRDLHPHLPALRGPRAVRRLGAPTRTSSSCSTATGRVVESTQLWWSVRPHHAFGTVELRICDAQTRGDEAFNLAALITACIAQSALDYDDGRLPTPLRHREIEENLWQAIRHGLDGDPDRLRRPARWSTRRAALERRPRVDRAGARRARPRRRPPGGERRPARTGADSRRGVAGRRLPPGGGRDGRHLHAGARRLSSAPYRPSSFSWTFHL